MSFDIHLVTKRRISLLLGVAMISLRWSYGEMWIWWTLVVLLFAATHAIKCPQMCDCQQPTDQQLTVDCGRRKVNESILAQDLDQQLSDEEIREHLTSLQISNTPLTQVPISVCHLTNLTSLNLDSNRFNRLPDNCFTRMRHLQWLTATENNITQIQDGLFDGLNSLRKLQFDKNQIKDIGLWIFSNQFDLINLKTISMQHNELRSLEPWPVIRGLHGSAYSRVVVDLSYNQISNFTNNMHWRINCSMFYYARLLLWQNNIKHLNDFRVGWSLKTFSEVACLFKTAVTGYLAFHAYVKYSHAYICDCQDFMFLKYQRYFVHFGLFERLVCNAPTRLANILVLQVPLKEFVCELSDRCPSSCRCVYRPENATLHVYCSAANLSSLPLELPPLPKSYDRYKLDFSNNKLLGRLEGRPYFVNTSILDVSNCAISLVGINAWREIAKMQPPFVTPHVYLQNNMIKSLPVEITNINITSVYLTLNHNPWECSCANQWMIDWFKSLSMTSTNVGDVMCASPSRLEGRSIVQSSKYDFCVDPSIRMLKISLLSTLTPVAVLMILGIAVYRLRVRLFIRWKFHPFDRDECVGEDMDYDVFLCYSSVDDNPHGRLILELIEAKGYRVCYHDRDFVPGLIHDNIARAIERSKRTVCLLSTNFQNR